MKFDDFDLKKYYEKDVKVTLKDGSTSEGKFDFFDFDVEEEGDVLLAIRGGEQDVYLEDVETIELV